MGQLMNDALGIGLAATQLGVMHRVLVYRVDPDAPVAALVNPVLEWSSRDEEALEEGCLSLPTCSSTSIARSTCGSARRTRHGEEILIEASGPRGAGAPARDGPPRRRADPRPHVARPAQAGDAHAPRGRGGRAARRGLSGRPDADGLPRHVGVRRRRARAAGGVGAPAGARRHAAGRESAGAARSSAPPPVAERARALGHRRHPAAGHPRRGRPGGDRGRRAGGARGLRLRRADQGAAALRLRDGQRAPVAAAALARRGAGRAGDHGRRRGDRRLDHAPHGGLGLRAGVPRRA